jgi:Photosynthesis system II assembly factor YCF48
MNTDEHRFGAKVLSALIGVHLWLILSPLSAEPRWNIQFFYDRADSNFAIEDLQCPTTLHCVAAGLIDDKNGHEKGAVVITSDGGLHWSQYEVKERPLSLFFLDESQGWMVTDRGLWSTVEGGRVWKKVQGHKGMLQAWFLDANHGYLTGVKGFVQETSDGGKTSTQLEASGQAPDASSLNYDIISFRGTHGIIIGAPNASSPILFDSRPQAPVNGKVTVLETVDGGKKWKYGTLSIDGELAQLRMSQQGTVVTLILYTDTKHPVASAVFEIPLGSRNGRKVFAQRDRAATDIALLSDGGAILAAIEPPGNSTQVPIPGRLRILRSENLKEWQEMDVDYRAIGQRAIIAAPDPRHMWVATDTGAILGLAE